VDFGAVGFERGEMFFFLRAHERRERDAMPALGKVAQDVMGFNFGTGVGRIGNDLGEEENLHW
jgi:hypothetical protein